MPWSELIGQRRRRSKRYEEPDLGRRAVAATIGALHYESVLDSGVYDAEVDMTPQLVDNEQFDGWRIVDNGWHYALGRPLTGPFAGQDGVVGFGGRQGAHWFGFRLVRAGYLDWRTRTWDDVGGAPTYDRANLSTETATLAMGPGQMTELHVATRATWANLWATPGGGALDAHWAASGDGLNEELVVNQVAREWIAANRPPQTPAVHTYFGFVFRLDWSDTPGVWRAGLAQDLEGDFADDGQAIELRDALDRLLAFLPVSDVIVRDAVSGEETREPLRKRFWRDGDGNHYLLVGVRCDRLNAMPAGDLIFDPTVSEQVGASSDDARENWGTMVLTDSALTLNSSSVHGGLRWTGVDVPAGATVDTAYISIYTSGSQTADEYLYAQDANNPGTFTLVEQMTVDRDRTTAYTAWSEAFAGAGDFRDSPSMVDPFQEVVDDNAGTGDALVVIMMHQSSASLQFTAWDGWSGGAAQVYIEYTEAAAGGDSLAPLYGEMQRRRRPLVRM